MAAARRWDRAETAGRGGALGLGGSGVVSGERCPLLRVHEVSVLSPPRGLKAINCIDNVIEGQGHVSILTMSALVGTHVLSSE